MTAGGEWVVAELMGRVKLAGFATEHKAFGGTWVRLDCYAGDGPPVATRLLPPPPGGPWYGLTVVDEAAARAFGKAHQPAPVRRWELPGEWRAVEAGPGDWDGP